MSGGDPYSRLFPWPVKRARPPPPPPPIVVRGTKVGIDRWPNPCMHARTPTNGDTKVGQYWQMRRYICQALSTGVGVTEQRRCSRPHRNCEHCLMRAGLDSTRFESNRIESNRIDDQRLLRGPGYIHPTTFISCQPSSRRILSLSLSLHMYSRRKKGNEVSMI